MEISQLKEIFEKNDMTISFLTGVSESFITAWFEDGGRILYALIDFRNIFNQLWNA